MQMTKEQRIFIVLEYETTKNCEQVRRAFNETFPERNLPDKKTVYRTVRKFNEQGSISNRYKGNSGRKIIQRTENNIAIVQPAITENPTISVGRNYYYYYSFLVRRWQPPWLSGLRPVLGIRSLLRAERPRVRNPAMNTSCFSFRAVNSHLSSALWSKWRLSIVVDEATLPVMKSLRASYGLRCPRQRSLELWAGERRSKYAWVMWKFIPNCARWLFLISLKSPTSWPSAHDCFEVTVDGVKVFSKLQMGNFPSSHETSSKSGRPPPFALPSLMMVRCKR
ncbi:Protein of unknown function DUF4817 [Trinorchestia longiramus]|nr:Protein of unknown function DUF4817 [Trinorchestia longiramus]